MTVKSSATWRSCFFSTNMLQCL